MLTSDYISSQSIESKQDPSVEHTAFISGYDIIKNNEDCWKELGFCPQFDALNLALTARETLTLYCHLRGVTENAHLFVRDLLNALGLDYAADRKASGYSLGMRRRLSIGVALVGNPGVVLLDEASTGVDPISRANIRLLLQQTCKNRALLLTSHNLEEVEALADNIGIMSRGEMKVIGSKNALKRKLTNHWQLNLQIVHGHEHETAVRVLSAITSVAISPRLDLLIKQVTATNISSVANGKDENRDLLTQSQAATNSTTLFTVEQLLHDRDYLSFIDECRRTAPNNGSYITECRSNTGIINVNKGTYTLAKLLALQSNCNSATLTFKLTLVPQSPSTKSFWKLSAKMKKSLRHSGKIQVGTGDG
jgi:ABC-type multidrug transport system ATPase subunit